MSYHERRYGAQKLSAYRRGSGKTRPKENGQPPDTHRAFIRRSDRDQYLEFSGRQELRHFMAVVRLVKSISRRDLPVGKHGVFIEDGQKQVFFAIYGSARAVYDGGRDYVHFSRTANGVRAVYTVQYRAYRRDSPFIDTVRGIPCQTFYQKIPNLVGFHLFTSDYVKGNVFCFLMEL